MGIWGGIRGLPFPTRGQSINFFIFNIHSDVHSTYNLYIDSFPFGYIIYRSNVPELTQ